MKRTNIETNARKYPKMLKGLNPSLEKVFKTMPIDKQLHDIIIQIGKLKSVGPH
jgi:hypothetical protein